LVFVYANQLTFSLISSVPPANGGMLYYCFLPDPFQFIVHELSQHLTSCNLSYWHYHNITYHKRKY